MLNGTQTDALEASLSARMSASASELFKPAAFYGGWPLFCGSEPLACMHTFFYYGGILAIVAWKRLGSFPRLEGQSEKFAKASYFGWHVPNIFLGGVMGYIALSCAWELWQTGDPKLMWGRTTQAAAVECGTWFMVFVGMDTLLSILHGDMDKETAVHHAIFAVVGLVVISDCSCPFLGIVLIGQELSTPPLNIFLILRAYKGMESKWTWTFFAVFALLFFTFRVFINTAVTMLFLAEVARGTPLLGGQSEITFTAPTQLLLSLAVVAGAAMQLRWGWAIYTKLRHALGGGNHGHKD